VLTEVLGNVLDSKNTYNRQPYFNTTFITFTTKTFCSLAFVNNYVKQHNYENTSQLRAELTQNMS